METNTGNGGMTQAGCDVLYANVDVIQTVTPTTGQTVVMTNDNKNGTLILTPAGTLATLTITFPTDGNSRVGQIRRFASTSIITALTINGAVILNSIVAIAVNECFSYQKVSANTWVRLI